MDTKRLKQVNLLDEVGNSKFVEFCLKEIMEVLNELSKLTSPVVRNLSIFSSVRVSVMKDLMKRLPHGVRKSRENGQYQILEKRLDDQNRAQCDSFP